MNLGATLISKGLRLLRRQGFAAAWSAATQFARVNWAYRRWLATFGRLPEGDRSAIKNHLRTLPHRPLISVLMPVYNPNARWLSRAIESVRRQLYPDWELCIADDHSTDPRIRSLLEKFQAADSRIRIVWRDRTGHISAAVNSALEIAWGEFVALFDHDDELAEHALYMVAVAANADPSPELIYSDEDKIHGDGFRFDPYFKPDWNPDLLRSQNYVNHLSVLRASTVRAAGGFREGLEGAQDWDLLLRVSERIDGRRIVHIPHVLYHWRVVPGSTALRQTEKGYAALAGCRALEAHCGRTTRDAEVLDAAGGHFRVRFHLPPDKPSVTVIVLQTIGHGDDPARTVRLRDCLTSFTHQVIMARPSMPGAPGGTLEPPEADNSPSRIHDVSGPSPANVLNQAARLASGQMLLILREDAAPVTPGSVEELVSQAMRPDIGAVGALLCNTGGKILHAGFRLHPAEIAVPLYRDCRHGDRGYRDRAALVQGLSAVSGACMALRRPIFLEAGGFDEKLGRAFYDIDLCLRLNAGGSRTLWTPYAAFSLEAPLEPGRVLARRFPAEAERMRVRWRSPLARDPAHNPNLSLEATRPAPPEAGMSVPWKEAPPDV